MRLLAALVLAGIFAGATAASKPVLTYSPSVAEAQDTIHVQVKGMRPGQARLSLLPGRIPIDPVFRVNRRGKAAFQASVPNVVPREYTLSVVRKGQVVAEASRPFTIVEPAPGIRDCSTSVYGRLGEDWQRSARRAGPIAFLGGGIAASYVPQHKEIKVLLVVDNPAVATLRVADADRVRVALLYANRGRYRGKSDVLSARDGLPAVTFKACSSNPWAPEDPHTQFNGSFIVERALCAHLEVHVEGRPEPIPAAIPVGAPC